MTGCACVTGRRQRRDRTRVFPDWRRGPAVMVALRRDGKPRQIPMARTLSAIAAGGRPAAVGCWPELAWASGLAGAWVGNAGRVPARIPPGRQRPDAPTYLLLRSGCRRRPRAAPAAAEPSLRAAVAGPAREPNRRQRAVAALTVAVLTLTRAGLAAQAASAASTYTATAWAVTVVRGCG